MNVYCWYGFCVFKAVFQHNTDPENVFAIECHKSKPYLLKSY